MAVTFVFYAVIRSCFYQEIIFLILLVMFVFLSLYVLYLVFHLRFWARALVNSREEDFAAALLGLRIAWFSAAIFLGSVLISGARFFFCLDFPLERVIAAALSRHRFSSTWSARLSGFAAWISFPSYDRSDLASPTVVPSTRPDSDFLLTARELSSSVRRFDPIFPLKRQCPRKRIFISRLLDLPLARCSVLLTRFDVRDLSRVGFGSRVILVLCSVDFALLAPSSYIRVQLDESDGVRYLLLSCVSLVSCDL
jgi:hypothetical protein